MLSHELPIYRSAYVLTILLFQTIRSYPREYKYTIGERVQETTLELLTSIYHANSSQSTERIEHLAKVIGAIETIRMCMRLSLDLRIISMIGFAKISEQIESIGKQSLAWRNSTRTGMLVR